MVVTANPHASRAGLAMLRMGGNALDAAVAAAFVLGVTEPQSSGLGGSGFLLYYRAADRRLLAFEGRETAPMDLPSDIFLGADGEPLNWREASTGAMAVGVPGWLKMAKLAHAELGKAAWHSLLQPAVSLAKEGFLISPRLHKLLRRHPRLGRQSPQLGFFDEDGDPLPIAAVFQNPSLAATLQTIAAEGDGQFYQGAIAEQIAATIKKNGGVMGRADLSAYRAHRLEPLCGDHRGYEVCSIGLPTSGGFTILRILQLSQKQSRQEGKIELPLSLIGPFLKGYEERKKLGDSMPRGGQPPSTTHISVVDSEGNIASMTASIGPAFGSMLEVGGFLLNGEMTDFAFDGAGPNRIRGGARPLSSQAPLIVFADGDPKLVMGSAGGLNIISYLARVLVEMIDLKKSGEAAVAAGNFSAYEGKLTVEVGSERSLVGVRRQFPQLRVRHRPMTSGISLIVISNGDKIGVPDPRREGLALGY